MKYHYSYRFFTYSVKREASVCSALLLEARGFCRARPALRTASGGEFDWGGTSVKR